MKARAKRPKAMQIDTALRQKLAIPAVHGYLVHFCLNLYEHSAKDIEQHWTISADEAYRLGVRSVPGLAGNLVAAQACVEKFGAEIVQSVPGFYHFNRVGSVCICHEWTDLCVCDLPAWRLDIDFCWSRRGLLLPVRNERGWIVNLKVFRHAQDRHPFTLKVRREDLAA